MIGRIFSYQIFWKEYRQMRGFWLSVFAMTVMLQVTICFVPVNPLADQLYGLAACFSVLYALGCGATMFAVEHENGTYDFLRALPTRGLPTFVSKVAFTVVSAPLLVIATLISAEILALSRDLYRLAPIEYLGLWAIGSTLLFVWAAFFSLLMRHAIKAALLGGCAAAITVPFLGFLHEVLIGLRSEPSMLSAYIAVVAVVSTLDVWLGIRWYREPSTWRGVGSRKRRRAELAETGTHGLEETHARISKFGHLVWLQWRQSRGMLLILSGILALCVVTFLFFSSLPMFAAATIIPIAGASVFAGDQKQYQFRFLTDRGLSFKSVWWSRHPVWILAILIWTAIAVAPLALMVTRWSVRGPQDAYYVIWMFVRPAILWLPLAYCFGQLCSMTIRSGILCGACAIVGSILLGLWAFAMSILDVPLFWSVLPIPVILLIATRMRTRGWLLEDNSLRSWLPVALVVTLPAAAILSGACMYRAYSCPLVEPGFDVAAFTTPATPEAQDTAKMYRRALDLATGETAEATKNEALALVLEASRRPQCDAFSKHFPMKCIEATERLAALLRHEGNRLDKQGDLDGALEYHLAALRTAAHAYMDPAIMPWAESMESMALADLVDWSTQHGQTKDRILKALGEVDDVTGQPVPFDNMIKDEYVQASELIDGDMNDMCEWLGPNSERLGPALMIYWMPWERERARRSIRWMTMREMDSCQQAQMALSAGKPIPQYILQATRQSPEPNRSSGWQQMNPDGWINLLNLNPNWAAKELVSAELVRRSTRIQMALAAWQLDHESLPGTLKELAGECLTKIPLDPYSGEEFVYFPDGVSEPLRHYDGNAGEMTVALEAGKPFFWSSGTKVCIGEKYSRGMMAPNGSPMEKYSLLVGFEWQRAASPEQVWAAGRVFPVPQPR